MAKGRNEKIYRVVKFEIHPSVEEIAVLSRVSDNLRLVYSTALAERQEWYEKNLKPLYDRLRESSSKEEEMVVKEEIKETYRRVKRGPTLFDQINTLTSKRAEDRECGLIPRNWQEETLDTLDGGFKSFMSLRKKGDMDARPPKGRDENQFYELVGRIGFKLTIDIDNQAWFEISFGQLGVKSRFQIPEYQTGKLEKAKKVKKFTLCRDPRSLDQAGRWWVSLAYELPQVDTPVPYTEDSLVYVHVGASSIGIISPQGEEIIPLWRPDRHWQEKIEAVKARMNSCQKGSRKWTKRKLAWLRMEKLKSRQQRLNHREVVSKLLKKGKHFIVSDYVVRSKVGKLADSAKPERGGILGLNWSAQNTGSIGELVAWLTEKVKESGGSVTRQKLVVPEDQRGLGPENKVQMVRLLKASYLNKREEE